ncbi:hypothetical protein BGZ96_000883 [Linnemannia gamsii]|uniref:Uncharacterized protein n=1 Tax=Linnemannia gamsii TaxID=64522 RepID=A0ABQ7JNC1_9FUNG|nr:hypothetical protein BGZ96_000883 [Linnemannia gamsii]
METEYLDIVNKELHDIQQFFAQYYYPPPTTQHYQHALSVLPLLKPTLTPPSSSLSSTVSTDDHGDDLFDFPSLYHTSPPPSTNDSIGDAVERDQYVADLRDRYKQLKAVQDQMHLELTRSRILKQSIQSVNVTNKPDDGAKSSPLPFNGEKGAHLKSAYRTTEQPLPFADVPDRSTVTTPAPPKETGGTVITTTTTGTSTGATTITTTTSTAVGTTVTEDQDSIAQQQPRTRSPFTFTGVRRLTGMICQDTKTLISSFSHTRYILVSFVLAVLFLVGLLYCIVNNNNSNNNNNVFGQHLPSMMDPRLHRMFVPLSPHEDTHHKLHQPCVPRRPAPPPADDRRYPWPRL